VFHRDGVADSNVSDWMGGGKYDFSQVKFVFWHELQNAELPRRLSVVVERGFYYVFGRNEKPIHANEKASPNGDDWLRLPPHHNRKDRMHNFCCLVLGRSHHKVLARRFARD